MNLEEINNILKPIDSILKKEATMHEDLTIEEVEIPENPHTHIRPKCTPGTHCEAFPHQCYVCPAETPKLKHDLYKNGVLDF